MFYLYGTYTGQLNEAGVSIQRQDVTSEASGLLVGFKEAWTITGFLQAASPDLLTVALTALEIAFSRNNQPLQLYSNSGALLRALAPLGALGGTRVMSGPNYPDDGRTSAEYSTFRTYQCVVEGSYAYANVPPTALLAYHEAVTSRGTGGPRFVYRQPLNGFPQKQLVADATPCRVIQRGQAVGLNAYPLVPYPNWPAAEHEDQREVEYGSPKKTGGVVGAVYTEWPVSWTYVFEDIAPPAYPIPNVVLGV